MEDIEVNKQRTELAVERYSQLVYGIILTQLKYKSDADDVYQEVFFTYFEKNEDFFDDEHEKAWLIRTTINICKRHDFSPWRIKTVQLSETNAQEEVILSTDEETRVFAEVRALKPKYKIPIYLHYFEDMPAEVIAKTLGIKSSSVRKQLQRGREILRQRLESDYFE